MGFLKASDTISGQEARAYTVINGVTEEMFYAKNLEASVEKSKAEIKTLGRRGTQHKATGWSGSGSMTIYYTTSKFRKIMLDYIQKGVDVYFDITITNEDPTSSVGRQTVNLKNVNLDSVIMASFDVEADALEEDLDFTFEDVEIIEEFKQPTVN